MFLVKIVESNRLYKVIFIVLGFLGSLVSINLVVNISDLLVGLLVVPNSIALILLRKKVIDIGKEYEDKLRKNHF